MKFIDIFESQIISRLIDIKARDLRTQGKSFYTIGSAGHEGMAVVGEISRLTDMAFLHYRDAAFLIQRSKKLPAQTIIYDLLMSFCARSDEPISGGRHKVLGSKKLFVPPQTSTIASHLPKAVGAALSLQKNKKLGIQGSLPDDSVIICTFGDASLNHASAQAALNTADWLAYQKHPLPIVFICEDNGIGISVKTPPDWVRSSRSRSASIKYFECDGGNLLDSFSVVQDAFNYSRYRKRPVFVRFKTVRLMGHAGSDVERVYLSQEEIKINEDQDPLLRSAKLLIQEKKLTETDIQKMYHSIQERINRIADAVTIRRPLLSAAEVMNPLFPNSIKRPMPPIPSDDCRERKFGNEWNQISSPQTMAKLINWGLSDILLQYNEAVIFGEDVAQKGGVYNVTANLEKRFGKIKFLTPYSMKQVFWGRPSAWPIIIFFPYPKSSFWHTFIMPRTNYGEKLQL
jgi:2-oxoisovalerate dehydrogenase E1 component